MASHAGSKQRNTNNKDMNTINFKKEGRAYVSDAFTITSDAAVVRVEFETAKMGNSLILERSITGTDWVIAGIVSSEGFDGLFYEFGIEGVISGQQLRLIAGAPVKNAIFLE